MEELSGTLITELAKTRGYGSPIHALSWNPYVKFKVAERSIFPNKFAVNSGPTVAMPGIYCNVTLTSLYESKQEGKLEAAHLKCSNRNF